MIKDKDCRKLTVNLFISAIFIFFVCLSGCGLDEYYYLDMPSNSNEISSTVVDYSEYLNQYVSFRTSETGNNYQFLSSSSAFSFLGTEVYYKIYNNYSTAYSHYSKVLSYNSSSSDYSAAAEYILDSLNYKSLKLVNDYSNVVTITPLIKPIGEDRYVYIRLNSYGDEEDFRSGVCISNISMNVYNASLALTDSSGNPVRPKRYINSNYGFDFSTSDTYNPVPEKDDDDYYYYSTSTENGTWYVALYAVSEGRDDNYKKSFSKTLPLGIIAISSK